MPPEFEKCILEGGRVRTIKLGGKKFRRICWDKKGKSHAGEVKESK